MKCVAIVLVILSLIGCTDRDPAQMVKILARPVLPQPGLSESAQSKLGQINRQAWRPDSCKNQMPPVTKTMFRVEGPCPYELKARVTCRAVGDDLYVVLKKEISKDAQFSIMLNVEHFKDAGDYDGARMFVLLREGSTGYRWSNMDVHLRVGPDRKYIDISESLLTGEPARRPCQRIAGQRWSYQFQCDEIHGSLNAIESTSEKVAGRIECASTVDEATAREKGSQAKSTH